MAREEMIFFFKIIFSVLILGLIFISNLLVVKLQKVKIRWAIKPLVVPSIMILFFLFRTDHLFPFFLIGGLFWGWFGDIFLLSKKIKFFIFGLLSFLIGHFLYIYHFIIMTNFVFSLKSYHLVAFLLLFILWGIGTYFISRVAKKLTPIISFYYFILILMVLAASLTVGVFSVISSTLTIIGSLLFLISDSLLGIRDFVKKIPKNTVSVMLTYMFAQLLIVIGYLVS